MPLKNFLDSSYSLDIIFLIVMGIFGLPTWIPLIRRKSEPYSTYRIAQILTASGQVVQAYFLIHAPLYYSLRYAAVGLPLCLISAGFASLSLVTDRRGAGCLVSATFTGLLWLFLIFLH